MKKNAVFGIVFGLIVVGIIIWMIMQKEEDALVVWHTESSPDTHKVLAVINDEFEGKYGVPVKMEYVSWGALSTKLNVALQTDRDSGLPDISHLQPYMAFSLYYDGRLEDLSDVIEGLNDRYPSGGIRGAVRDLQMYDDRHYGIAQHVGVSFIFYNAELLENHDLEAPVTWEDFFQVCRSLRDKVGDDFYPVAMPGSSPFFMECILSEYLNSRGARLFNDAGVPRIKDNKELLEVLEVFAKMSDFVTRDFERLEYPEQFQKLVDGDAAFVMFAGARAFSTFEKLDGSGGEPNRYRVLEPPTFANGGERLRSYTSVDCEPWVVFKKGKEKSDLAKKWLALFYERKNYLEFCQSVPIQLIPIFSELDSDYEENPTLKKYRGWYDHALKMIDEPRVRPYFMQQGDRHDLDFLFKLYNKQILYNLVMACVRAGEVPEGELEEAEREIRAVIERFSRTVNVSEK